MEELIERIRNKIFVPSKYQSIYSGRINDDWIRACVDLHQRQYPASWQDWKVEPQSRKMTTMINAALRAKETDPSMVILYGQ